MLVDNISSGDLVVYAIIFTSGFHFLCEWFVYLVQLSLCISYMCANRLFVDRIDGGYGYLIVHLFVFMWGAWGAKPLQY